MKKISTFKIFVSEFNKLKINEKFNENDLLNKINNNLPNEKYAKYKINNLHNYLIKMVKSGYIVKIDNENYHKFNDLPNYENFSSIDLDIQSRIIKIK